MTVVTNKDRDAAHMLSNREPAILRGIYRDDLDGAFAAHREEAVRELVKALERCALIVERYNGRQNEKIEDVKLIARQAIANHKGDKL